MSTDPQIQTVAAANALSGEKTFRSFQFAVTGCPDGDVICGIYTLLNQSEFAVLDARAKCRILQLVTDRFKDAADFHDRFQDLNRASVLQGIGAAQQGQQIYPSEINTAGSLLPGTSGTGPWQQQSNSALANSKPDASSLGNWIKSLGLK